MVYIIPIRNKLDHFTPKCSTKDIAERQPTIYYTKLVNEGVGIEKKTNQQTVVNSLVRSFSHFTTHQLILRTNTHKYTHHSAPFHTKNLNFYTPSLFRLILSPRSCVHSLLLPTFGKFMKYIVWHCESGRVVC